MEKKEKIIIALCVIATIAAGALHYAHANAVLAFVVTAAALALLAVIVGDATEQLGSRLGPGATGILQSGLGNLPELFVCIFALRAGLDQVVQAALIGSILGNSVLVLGLALFLGGIKNGTQRFKSEPPKMIVALMLLAASALIVPTLAKELHTPAEPHIASLDIFLAVILLIWCFWRRASIFRSRAIPRSTRNTKGRQAEWSMKLTVAIGVRRRASERRLYRTGLSRLCSPR